VQKSAKGPRPQAVGFKPKARTFQTRSVLWL